MAGTIRHSRCPRRPLHHQASRGRRIFAPLLAHYQKTERIARIRRGIYRLVHFPSGEQEELVTAWLWSDSQGALSHQTALALHGLSDVLPAQIHLTLPLSWRPRRLRVPRGLVLHHADVPPSEQAWAGAVPVTSVRRTLNDCAVAGLSPDLLRQGAKQALARGLVTRAEMGAVQKALNCLFPAGPIPAGADRGPH